MCNCDCLGVAVNYIVFLVLVNSAEIFMLFILAHTD